ncbi:hypothetical protein DFR49_2948 [Hephaestia caeni]|uniref:Uncharacterized protein n=1 Tax=Hephaestia caeni TaxID=645617 RepID=A0A397P730_9SPHN|nr:hypothetical protein [Hephaestia caeni]RIA44688.1 hypothetical protein DFR49_2948 [Hephaestia caeni]
MLVAAKALMFDFYGNAAGQSDAEATPLTERWDLTARQRLQPPYPHNHLLISPVNPGDTFAARAGTTLSAGPLLPRHEWDGEANDARTRFALLALTNPKDGREDDYDRWYWDRHFPDGRRLPGCFAGRRYLLAEGGAGPYRHLAIYLYDNDDVGDTLDVLLRIAGTPEMPGSDSISPGHDAWYVEPHRRP